MAIVTIDSVDYEVSVVDMDFVELDEMEETWGGTMVSSRPGTASVYRVWTIETAIHTKAEIETLRAALLAPGTVTASGEGIASSGTVVCRGVSVGRAQKLLEDWRTLRFGLEEVTP